MQRSGGKHESEWGSATGGQLSSDRQRSSCFVTNRSFDGTLPSLSTKSRQVQSVITREYDWTLHSAREEW